MEIETVSAELLSHRTITEGMIVLGAIKEIHSTYVTVALPGRLYGHVSVTAISKSYLNIVNMYVNDVKNENDFDDYKNIENLFEIGQIVCVKVTQIDVADDTTNTRYRINLSMSPADINTDMVHSQIDEGLWMPAAVESVEDHGYVMETGVKNLRGFLAEGDVFETNLGVGEVAFCRIKKAKVSSNASTAMFSTHNPAARKLKMHDDLKTTFILPSTIVKFKITKILKDGIQGTINNGLFTAYINEHQLSAPLASPEDYAVDSVHNARVLYVMPITKLVYLSLNLKETIISVLDETIKIGDIIDNARVVRNGTCGLILRMNGNVKGIISLKTIRVGVTNFDTDDLMAKYYKNSAHRVRVIGCDPIDSAYICSLEEKVLNEKYFAMDDVAVGDFVDAKISTALGDGGYFVRVGKLAGKLSALGERCSPELLFKINFYIAHRLH